MIDAVDMIMTFGVPRPSKGFTLHGPLVQPLPMTRRHRGSLGGSLQKSSRCPVRRAGADVSLLVTDNPHPPWGHR
jgi:hypothetical protein